MIYLPSLVIVRSHLNAHQYRSCTTSDDTDKVSLARKSRLLRLKMAGIRSTPDLLIGIDFGMTYTGMMCSWSTVEESY
jgi:hypothetical protein